MYVSGSRIDFDHRVHQFSISIQELELYEDEARNYTGIWVQTKDFEKHQKIFQRAAISALSPPGAFVHGQFFTGVDYF